MKRTLFLLLLTFVSCERLETFYHAENKKSLNDGTTTLIQNDVLNFRSAFRFYIGDQEIKGVAQSAEIKIGPNSKINEIEFWIKPKLNHQYKTFASIHFMGHLGIEKPGEIKMFDFLEAINTHSSATGHFKFNVKAKEFDSLYLRYRLNLKYIGKDTTFLGEDVFYKTSYSPALSR